MAKKHPTTMAMTDAQFKQKMIDLYAIWRADSNKSNQGQSELSTVAEAFINDFVDSLDQVGGNPGPPRPRVRP